MPSLLYNIYLITVISLFFLTVYVAGSVVIVTALKQKPHIVMRIGVIVIVFLMMLRLPIALFLHKI